MTAAKDLTQLGKLVAASHGWPATKAFKAYKISDRDRSALTNCAINLLKIFPDTPKASALMSAAFAVQLERVLDAPIHVIAGTLVVNGNPVIGDRSPLEEAASITASEHDWNCHVWVMVGPYIADISLFRTAYSPTAPAQLAHHIERTFGPNKALYVDQWKRTKLLGLGYEPQYVLSADQVTALMGGAYRVIQESQQTTAKG